MQAGLPTSISLHVGLLALALFSWGRSHDEAAQPVEAIEVEIGETTQVRLGSRTGQKMDEIQPKEQAAAKERDGKRAGTSKQEEPPPPPQAKPEPPQPKPEPPKEVASLPKEEPVPQKPEAKPEPAKPVAKPEEKPPEEKKVSDKAPEIAKEPPPPVKPPEKKEPPKPEPAKDAAALDKLLAKADTKPTPLPPKAPAQPKPAAQTAPKATSGFNSKEISDILNKSQTGTAAGKAAQTASLGSPNGVNAKIKMSVSELDAFMGQVQKCWNPPPGASDANLVARIQVVLQPDGSLAATPQTIEAPSHPMGPAYANSAVRAIRMCAPYRLPPEKFEQWHDNVLTFVPKM